MPDPCTLTPTLSLSFKSLPIEPSMISTFTSPDSKTTNLFPPRIFFKVSTRAAFSEVSSSKRLRISSCDLISIKLIFVILEPSLIIILPPSRQQFFCRLSPPFVLSSHSTFPLHRRYIRDPLQKIYLRLIPRPKL